jgi:hypothetical protein
VIRLVEKVKSSDRSPFLTQKIEQSYLPEVPYYVQGYKTSGANIGKSTPGRIFRWMKWCIFAPRQDFPSPHSTLLFFNDHIQTKMGLIYETNISQNARNFYGKNMK